MTVAWTKQSEHSPCYFASVLWSGWYLEKISEALRILLISDRIFLAGLCRLRRTRVVYTIPIIEKWTIYPIKFNKMVIIEKQEKYTVIDIGQLALIMAVSERQSFKCSPRILHIVRLILFCVCLHCFSLSLCLVICYSSLLQPLRAVAIPRPLMQSAREQ